MNYLPETDGLRGDAHRIINRAIRDALPDEAVRRALSDLDLRGRATLVAVGKAAWSMAAAARDVLGEAIEGGAVITKYGHTQAPLPGLEIFEAGHPVPDGNTFAATRAVIDLVRPLGAGDTVLFLVSGGGSALFEQPLIPPEELQEAARKFSDETRDLSDLLHDPDLGPKAKAGEEERDA